MASTMRAGNVDGLDYAEAPKLDEAYADEAASWFDAERESVSHTADDGTELLGWHLPGAEGGAYADGHTWAVVCHGYIGKPADMAKYAYHFSQLGMDVLMPAARGHERNEDAGLIQMGWGDARDLVGWVSDIVAADPDAKILLFGTSMGGAEVMMASGMDGLADNVRLIVEDCGYTSVWDEFELQLGNVFGLPSFPILNAADLACQLRAGYTFEAASAVESLRSASVPMLFIHGDADTFVPFSMLDECFERLRERGEGEACREGRRPRPLRQHRPHPLLGDGGRLRGRQPSRIADGAAHRPTGVQSPPWRRSSPT